MNVKFIVPFFLLVFLFSCEKDSDNPTITPNIEGNWQLESSNFQLKPNTSFIMYDLFGEPWKGNVSLILDGENVTLTTFEFFKDNIFGSFHWMNDTISFTYTGNSFYATYKNTEYVLNGTNLTVDFNEISFSGDFENSSNERISITGSLNAKELTCETGNEYLVKDGYSFERTNPYTLFFHEDGELSGEVLDIDVILPLMGHWTQDEDKITITYNFSIYQSMLYVRTYKASIDGNSMYLTENLRNIDDYCNQLGINGGDLVELNYKTSYQRIR